MLLGTQEYAIAGTATHFFNESELQSSKEAILKGL